MYYLNPTGLVFTEHDIKKSFEIIYGIKPYDSDMYPSFRLAVIKDKKCISDEACEFNLKWLIKHKAKVPAIIMYRDVYKCSLGEAKYKIEEILNEN